MSDIDNAIKKSDGSTLIISNGVGRICKISTLLDHLKSHTLTTRYFEYSLYQFRPWVPMGCFNDSKKKYYYSKYDEWIGSPKITGNFYDFHYPFNIITKDIGLQSEMQKLINKNIIHEKFMRDCNDLYCNYWIGKSKGFKRLIGPAVVKFINGESNYLSRYQRYLKDAELIKKWDLSIFDSFK